MASRSAVVGIDLGSADSFVAFVGKGAVDIAQNEVSRRNTPTLVGFTDRERLLGDSALAQIKSNARNTCRNFKHLLGQDINSPYVEKERFWSTSSIAQADDGCPGYEVTYKGESQVISAVQATAMFLTKLKDVAETWTQATVKDCVIAIPSYFSDVHRQAVLDAATVAGMSVLSLMNEHAATALGYGIYRTNDFDAEKPMRVAFCSMGHSIFSVSIVQFVKGKLTVISEKSDKVGGRDMDECLMREFAAQFEKKFGCNPLSSKKASFKLEDAVLKTKKVLSANTEASLSCECLMEDQDFGSNITREAFEKMCEPMMAKVQAVLEGAKAAAGITVEEIDSVEIVGGASRVPWVKKMCSDAFGGKALSTTMNADESVARGAALQAAILSPLYKVRDFKVEDFSPFAINISWMGGAADAQAPVEDDPDMRMTAGEGEYKTATVFPAWSLVNQLKMLTFYRKEAFDLNAEYSDGSTLVVGTQKAVGNFKIVLPPQQEAKKVKVKAKLSLSGMFTIETAQLVEVEEYEETVKEKREISEENHSPEGDESVSKEEQEKNNNDAGGKNEEAKQPEKKYEWIDVVKKKQRTKQTDLNIVAAGCPGLSAKDLQTKKDEESQMQADMREIIETDARRNDLESYIFTMRDKIYEHGELGPFVSTSDRETFIADLTKVEDWLYEAEGATKVMYVEKLDELRKQGDPIKWRHQENQVRGEWIEALSGTIANFKAAAQNPGDKYGHIALEKLGKIVSECDAVSIWLSEMQSKQAKLSTCERPVVLCADIEKKSKDLAKFADEILSEPKPKPVEPEKRQQDGHAHQEEEPNHEERKTQDDFSPDVDVN